MTACAPAATQVVVSTSTPVTIRETSVVVQTQIVEQEVVVTATPSPDTPEGTLTVAVTTDVATLEVPHAPETQTRNVAIQLYDSLLFPEADGTLSPALAESWEISDDGKEYTFHLRHGVKFHNGEDFTADSVVYSWQIYTDPEVAYAGNWTVADSVEKIDDYTVRMTTPDTNPLFLATVANNWTMIPPKYHAEVGLAGFAQKPVGTGPFRFVEWVKGDHITYEANPDYWLEGFPEVQTLIFKPLPESATRVAAIQAGEIDLAVRLTSEDASQLLGDPNVQVLKYPVDRVYYVAFNNLTTGLNTPIIDKNVRLAINHAIDVQAIIDALFNGFARRSTGMVSAANLGYDNAEPFAYDPEKAKALLAEAGYPDGFEIDMACPDGAYAHINEVCEAIAGYLGDVGIKVNLNIMESNAYWDLEAKQQLPPLFVDSWTGTTGEANQRLQGSLGKGETYAAWYDADLEALLNKAFTTMDRDERAKVYGEIQQVMREDPPFVYLYEPEAFEAVRTRVNGYAPRSAENYYLRGISVDD